VALGFAVPKYLRSRDQRSGETLLHLESRFQELQSPWPHNSEPQPAITRIIDPEANKFSTSVLATAIDFVLKRESDKHDDLQNAWMSRLDELLRFLSLVAAMEVNRLLNRRALWDAYYYWFCAIWKNEKLREYVRIYSPVLYEFLHAEKDEIEKYWERIESANPSVASNDRGLIQST
jgi:hypothetical protein